MSEGRVKAASHASIKLAACAACCPADAGAECACCLVGKSRVQVRAKVLYGSGTAIANLRAKEKTASHRPPNF